MLANLMREVARPSDVHVVIARHMARDEASQYGSGTAAIVRRRRRQAQDATTIIIAKATP